MARCSSSITSNVLRRTDRMRLRTIALPLVLSGVVAAQGSQSDPRFEAVSIKLHNPTVEGISTGRTGSEWTAIGASLLLLLKNAFPEFADEGRIVGTTDWMLNT